MSDINHSIDRLYGTHAKTDSHRLLAWERCYKYFYDNKDILQYRITLTDKTPEEPMLHLAAYLANWGMYQGDTFLLKTDYTIYGDVLYEMLKKDYKNLWTKCRDIDAVAGKSNERKEFAETLTGVSAKIKEIWKGYNASDLLVTKMLMGTYGSILGYDRLVVEGLKQHGISPNFCKESIHNLLNFYLMNKEELDRPMPLHISDGSYTRMRKMDMYFFVRGGALTR